METQKSLVALSWYNVKDPSVRHSRTGFIFEKNVTGIFILSVADFIPELFKDAQTPIPNSEIGVQVVLFNEVTKMDASVLHYNLTANMVAIVIKHCTEMDNYPFPCIEPLSFSTDPTYPGQSVKAMHHATTFEGSRLVKQEHFNLSTKGFVADSNYSDSGLIHFSFPLVFRGSLGAPVFDKHSNMVVSMIKGWDCGMDLGKPFDPKHWSIMKERYFGSSVSSIQQFLAEVQAALR